MIDLISARVLYASPAFKRKLKSALAIVADALRRRRNPYIAFSGGKDSLAVVALVHHWRPDVILQWSDDELEYPESVEYMTRLAHVAGGQFAITLGYAEHAGWFRPWTDAPSWREPLPGSLRIEMDADDWAASSGHDLTFLGLRMEENRRRREWLARAGPLYRSSTGTGWRCNPIWDWSADDVWALIAGWELPYNPVYDRLEAIHVPRRAQRVGPLPLARRAHLEAGWPEMLERLEARYGRRWE